MMKQCLIPGLNITSQAVGDFLKESRRNSKNFATNPSLASERQKVLQKTSEQLKTLDFGEE